MSRQTIPNFFIAGAPKAGTTSLYHYLAQHPDIFMSPVKEPTFFALEMRPENFVPELQDRIRSQETALRANIAGPDSGNATQGLVTRWEDYLRLFANAGSARAIGEGSVCYLWSRTAAREILAANPSAKFILILRHPAERAFSQYLHYLSDGHAAHSFSAHIQACLKADGRLGPFYPFLEFGLYAEQLERLLSQVPRSQVHVRLYEDTVRTPSIFLREVFDFLNVAADFVPDTRRRYLEMEIPRALGATQVLQRTGAWQAFRKAIPVTWKPKIKKLIYRRRGSLAMNAEDRALLVSYYRNDVKRLEHLLERDLSGWMQ